MVYIMKKIIIPFIFCCACVLCSCSGYENKPEYENTIITETSEICTAASTTYVPVITEVSKPATVTYDNEKAKQITSADANTKNDAVTETVDENIVLDAADSTTVQQSPVSLSTDHATTMIISTEHEVTEKPNRAETGAASQANVIELPFIPFE